MPFSCMAACSHSVCGCFKFLGSPAADDDCVFPGAPKNAVASTAINGIAVRYVGEGTFGSVFGNLQRGTVWKRMKIHTGSFHRSAYRKKTDAVRVLGREPTGKFASQQEAAEFCAAVANVSSTQTPCTLRKGPLGWAWDVVPTRASLAVIDTNGNFQAAPLEVDLALDRVCSLCEHFKLHGGWPENMLPVKVLWTMITESDGIREHTAAARVIQMQYGKCFKECIMEAQERKPLMERFASVGTDVVRYLQRINVRHVDMKQGNWVVLPNGTAHGQLKLADIDAARCNDGILTGCGTYSPVDPNTFFCEEERAQVAAVQNVLMAWCFACAACDPEHYDQNYATDYSTLIQSKCRLLKALRYNRRTVEVLLIGLVDFAIMFWESY